MWKRSTLKKTARKHVKAGYWRMISVCFLIATLTTSYPLATTFFSQHTLTAQYQTKSAYMPEDSNSEVLNDTIEYISDDAGTEEALDSYSFRIADILIDLYTNASSVVFSALRAFNSLLLEPLSYSTLFLMIGVFLSFGYQFFISNLLLVGEARFFLEIRN